MREWGVRIGLYVLGLFVLSGGSTLTIAVDLGVQAVNSFPYALSRTLGVSYGTAMILVFILFIGIQYLLLGKQFRAGNLLQLPVTFLYGIFGDFWMWVFSGMTLEPYPAKLAGLLVCISCVGGGVALYVTPNIMPNPADGLTIAVAQRLGKPFSFAKTMTDSIIVLMTLITGFVFLDGASGVREGTVISALLTGKAAGIFLRVTRPLAARLAGTDAFLPKTGGI